MARIALDDTPCEALRRPPVRPVAAVVLVLLCATLSAGCVTTRAGDGSNSGIAGAAPGADPQTERARGR
jgi:hypothetical protein